MAIASSGVVWDLHGALELTTLRVQGLGFRGRLRVALFRFGLELTDKGKSSSGI